MNNCCYAQPPPRQSHSSTVRIHTVFSSKYTPRPLDTRWAKVYSFGAMRMLTRFLGRRGAPRNEVLSICLSRYAVEASQPLASRSPILLLGELPCHPNPVKRGVAFRTEGVVALGLCVQDVKMTANTEARRVRKTSDRERG